MINRSMFSEEKFDSGSLRVLSSVIHKFSEAGKYHGTIFRGSNIVGRFSILVCEESRSTSSSCDEQSIVPGRFKRQVNVDLKHLDLPVSQHLESQECNCYELILGGYAVFHISTGRGGYAVEIKKTGSKCGSEKVFDSRKLAMDDLFSATVLRPGTYSITNVVTNAKGELTVTYPEVGKTQRNPKPITIECDKSSITPNKIRIDPTQGLVFKFNTPSRIEIQLTKPEDRRRPDKIKKQIMQTQQLSTISKKKIRRRIRINPRSIDPNRRIAADS